MKKLIFIFAMLIALNLDLLASETITLGDTLWCRKTANIEGVAFHPNSKYIATGSDDDVIRIWDVETGTISHTFSGYDVCFSDSGNYLCCANCIINCNTWQLAYNYGAEAISTDETIIVQYSSSNNTIRLYKLITHELINQILLDSIFPTDPKGNRDYIQAIKFTKDGKYLIFTEVRSGLYSVADANVAVWKMDLTTYAITKLSTQGGGTIALSPDGKLIAFASNDSNYSVKVMNFETNEIVAKIPQESSHYQSEVDGLAFTVDTKYLAVSLGLNYPKIKILNLETKVIDYEFLPGGGPIALSNSNKYLSNDCGLFLLYPTPWGNTSVKESETDTTILYPNPTGNIITLQTTIENNNNIIANIYDAQSNLVLNKIYNNLSIGLNNIEINVSSLSNGIYYLQLINNNITTSYKLIISK